MSYHYDDTALLAELQEKIDAVQKETKDMKVRLQLTSGAKKPKIFSITISANPQQAVDALDPTAYVSPSQLEQALRQQEEAMKRQIETLGALDSKVDAINGDLDKLAQQMKEAEVRKIRGLMANLQCGLFFSYTYPAID